MTTKVCRTIDRFINRETIVEVERKERAEMSGILCIRNKLFKNLFFFTYATWENKTKFFIYFVANEKL